MSVVHGGVATRGTTCVIDPDIRKRVYRVVDAAGEAGRVGLTIPGASSEHSVRALGRYAYLEYRAVPNPDKRAARVVPLAPLSFSLDAATKQGLIFRLSFSSEYARPGELQMGRIAHIPLPM